MFEAFNLKNKRQINVDTYHRISQKLNMISYANSFNLKPIQQREIEEILIEQLPRIIKTWNIYFNDYQ